MKFFFKQSPTIDSTKNPTLKKFIQDHPQKFCDEWAATPNLFFSHVTSMNDFFYVYNALPQLQKQLQAYVEVSMATLLTWDLKASEFIQLLNIVNNKSKFLAALVQNPNNALHLFQKEQHKRELIQLVIGMANNSSSPLLASFFDLFFLDFINTMPIKETESFLLAVSQSCVHDWIEKKLTGSLFKDDKFLKIWPMLITICDVKMLNKKISDMNELNRLSVEKLSEIFAPLLSTQDDSNFIDLYNYFVDGNFLRVRAYFQQYFLDKLQKTDRASPELAELFAQRHLSPDTEFVQCTWEQHIHWIKLFPERLEILTTLLVNEEVFRARKVTVAQIEAMVATLGESGRVVLAILLRSIKRYKVSPFQTLDLDRLAVFASKQIGEKDCALAFCLVELYWDVVKWQGVDEDTFIAKCSSDACNEYACQQDAKGLTEFTRLLLTTPVHLFVLLFKRLTKETMDIALHMNREQVHRFFRSDAGKEKLQSVIAQLNQHEFAMLVTFLEPPFIFSGKLSNLRERFCDLLLDPNFNYEKAPGFSAFLTDANQAIFDNMLNIMGVDLKFLQRVRENESLQKYFATS